MKYGFGFFWLFLQRLILIPVPICLQSRTSLSTRTRNSCFLGQARSTPEAANDNDQEWPHQRWIRRIVLQCDPSLSCSLIESADCWALLSFILVKCTIGRLAK